MTRSREIQPYDSLNDNVKLQVMCSYLFYTYQNRGGYQVLDRDHDYRSEFFREATNILYLILANTYQNAGDKEKIINYLESKVHSVAKENKPKVYFYRGVSRIIASTLYPVKSDDKLNVNFPQLSYSQGEGIFSLIKYLCNKFGKFDQDEAFEDEGAYKFNTALTAITELFKPHPDVSNLESLLTTYKKQMDRYSFLRKLHVTSDKGDPGHLRFILAEIIESLRLKQQPEEKQKPIGI